MLQLYKNIKKKRLELGLSQEELAKKTGYSSRSMIAKIEAGDIDLYQSKIDEIAKALNSTSAELMGWENEFSLGGKEEKMADLFSLLNEAGQDKALEQVELLSKIPEYKAVIHEPEPILTHLKLTDNGVFENSPTIKAAHERTDIEVTDEMRKHDDDIMNDDNF